MSARKGHKVIIFALMVTIIIDVMGLGLVFPILPSLFVGTHSALLADSIDDNVRYILYGIGMAAWPLGIFFGTPYLGDLSDKYGRKNIIMLALFGTAVAYAISAIAIHFHSYWVFVIGRVLSGFFASSFPIAQAVVADISPFEEKSKNLGWISFAGALGFVVGPLISSFTAGGEFASSFTITTPFWIAVCLALLNMICLTFLLKETFPSKPDKKIRYSKIFTSCKFVFIDKRTRHFALLFLLVQIGWGFYMQGVPLVMSQQYQLTTHGIGLFFMVFGLSFALGQLFVLPRLLRRFSLKKLFIGSTVTLGLVLCLTVLFQNLILQWFLMFFAAQAELLSYSSIITLFSNAVGRDEQGKVMGGTGSIFGVSWVANALLLGNIVQIGILLPLVFSSGFVLLCCLCSLNLREPKNIHEPGTIHQH